MIGTKSITEDYNGVNPCWDDTLLCSKCGEDLDRVSPIKDNGEYVCPDCTEIYDLDDVKRIGGFSSNYELLDALGLTV